MCVRLREAQPLSKRCRVAIRFGAINFICILPALLFLIPVSAVAQTCTGSALSLVVAGNPHSDGIECLKVNGFILTLRDGVVVSTASAVGIQLTGTGKIEVTSITGGKSTIRTTGDGNHGIEIGAHEDNRPSQVKISVVDVETNGERTDGIRIGGVTESVELVVLGTVWVKGPNSDGIYIENNVNGDSNSEINLRVHNVVSEGADDPEFENSALNVNSVGKLAITSTGSISTVGDFNYGIHALKYGTDSESSGPIRINVNNLLTKGNESYGILVQILSSENAGVEIGISGKFVTEGAKSHGIGIEGKNADFKLTVAHTGSLIIKNPSAYGVLVSTDQLRSKRAEINNHGEITAGFNVRVCDEATINNFGNFFPRTQVLLKEGFCAESEGQQELRHGAINNSGIVNPFGPDQIGSVTFDSDFVQSRSGTLGIDVDWVRLQSDFIEILGVTKLDGSLVVNNLSKPFLFDRSAKQVKILRSMKGVSGKLNADLLDTLMVNYELGFIPLSDSTGQEVELMVDLDLSPDGLNRNQVNVLSEISDSAFDNESISDVFQDFLLETNIQSLRNGLDRLGNEVVGAVIYGESLSSLRSNIPSAPCDTPLSATSESILAEGTAYCAWAGLSGQNHQRVQTFENLGFTGSSRQIAAGLRFDLNEPQLKMEIAVSNRSNKTVLGSVALSDGRGIGIETRLSGTTGGFKLSIGAAINSTNHDIKRHARNGTQADTSSGRFSTRTRAFRLSGEYGAEIGALRVIPSLELSRAIIDGRPYSETGAEDLSLVVAGSSTKIESVRPGLRIESEIEIPSGTVLTPAFGISRVRVSGNDIAIRSGFKGGKADFLTHSKTLGSLTEIRLGTGIRHQNSKTSGDIEFGASFGNGKVVQRRAIASLRIDF